MKINFAAPKLPQTGAIATGVMDGGKFSPTAAELDRATGGALTRAIKGTASRAARARSCKFSPPPG